jgi:hypothetical protein
MNYSKLSRFFLAFTVLWCMCVFLAGCTAAWTGQAVSIINLLVPSITAALAILAAFGTGVAPTALSAIQSWSKQATDGLQTVAGLIDQYNAADATAKPGILTEIQTALKVITDNLKAILPEIHITNAKTQAEWDAVIASVAGEIESLVNLVPALKGEVTSHEELKALVAAVKSPKEFLADFNAKAGVFGKEYHI